MPLDSDSLVELQAQVRNLERRVAALEGHAVEPAVPEPRPERLESRLGVTLISRAGAVTLALGILFFFKYAVDNRWIGAAGRVALGIIAGLVLVGVAERLRGRGQQAFAQGVAGCGIAILYTALYASFAYYHLFPQWLAFCGMIAACALSFALSFRYGSSVLAVLGTAGAIFAPVFMGHVFHHARLFFSYLLLVNITVFAAALRRRWMALMGFVFAATFLLFSAWTCSSNATVSTATGLLFLCAFFALFFTAALVRSVPALLPWNTAWTVFSAWMLLNGDHPEWLAAFVLGLAVAHFTAALRGARKPAVRNWLYALGHACLLTAALRELNIWAVNHSAPVNRASIISESTSVFLALYALAAIAWGVIRRSRLDRIAGLVLLIGVIGKLYCYDVWQLARFYRISAFVALGVLLLAASYIYSRFREKLGVLWARDGAEP